MKKAIIREEGILVHVLWVVYDAVLDPKLIFFTDEAWYHLSGYINVRNNRYWSSNHLRET
jgi:hypothetical protein